MAVDAKEFLDLLARYDDLRIATLLVDSGVRTRCHRTTVSKWRQAIKAATKTPSGKIDKPELETLFEFLKSHADERESRPVLKIVHGKSGLALSVRLIALTLAHLHDNHFFKLSPQYNRTKENQDVVTVPWLLDSYGVNVEFIDDAELGIDALDEFMNPKNSLDTGICLASRDACLEAHRRAGIVRICEIGRARIPALIRSGEDNALTGVDRLQDKAIGCPDRGLYPQMLHDLLEKRVYRNFTHEHGRLIVGFSTAAQALRALKEGRVQLIVGPPRWCRLPLSERIGFTVYEGDIFGKTDYNIFVHKKKCDVISLRKLLLCLTALGKSALEHARHAKIPHLVEKVAEMGKDAEDARNQIEKDTTFEVCNVDLDAILELWGRESNIVRKAR